MPQAGFQPAILVIQDHMHLVPPLCSA